MMWVKPSEHRSTIWCKNSTYAVTAHFLEENHSISSLRYIGIEHVILPRRGGDLDNLLLKQEAAWIFNLKTLAPYGLNVDFALKPLLWFCSCKCLGLCSQIVSMIVRYPFMFFVCSFNIWELTDDIRPHPAMITDTRVFWHCINESSRSVCDYTLM